VDNISVRIRLASAAEETKGLKAYCSIEIPPGLIINDMKIIDGRKGLYVAMPSRKLCERCPKCRTNVELLAKFCQSCGEHQPQRTLEQDNNGRLKRFADIVHPVTQECRSIIHEAVMTAYEESTK